MAIYKRNDINLSPCEKPPLGVKPKWLHDEHRAEELKGAIGRHLAADWKVPIEWVNEYNSLVKKGSGTLKGRSDREEDQNDDS
ncbi:putative metal-dependent hydrolase I [Bacillus phage BSP14]|nr:putative metal-dependent hydrolase I [Bacillus phage BSP14]AYJ76204.1 hypothetical protein BSP12_018 [Bacillus phage BSP12]